MELVVIELVVVVNSVDLVDVTVGLVMFLLVVLVKVPVVCTGLGKR